MFNSLYRASPFGSFQPVTPALTKAISFNETPEIASRAEFIRPASEPQKTVFGPDRPPLPSSFTKSVVSLPSASPPQSAGIFGALSKENRGNPGTFASFGADSSRRSQESKLRKPTTSLFGHNTVPPQSPDIRKSFFGGFTSKPDASTPESRSRLTDSVSRPKSPGLAFGSHSEAFHNGGFGHEPDSVSRPFSRLSGRGETPTPTLSTLPSFGARETRPSTPKGLSFGEESGHVEKRERGELAFLHLTPVPEDVTFQSGRRSPINDALHNHNQLPQLYNDGHLSALQMLRSGSLASPPDVPDRVPSPSEIELEHTIWEP